MGNRELLLGDEAVALGAIHAGISGAYSYPGTPATELFEFVHEQAAKWNIHANWSANEKVAYEEALGMSMAGKRVVVSMKHVGLNVAADPFMNSAVTGVTGGFVLCMGDDPGMHSSQNEQDSRVFAKFALIPCFEPANQQEAYDMTRMAYDISEACRVPILMRLTTRLAHSRSDVVTREPRPKNGLAGIQEFREAFTLLPSNARAQYKKLTELQATFERLSFESPYNELCLEGDRKRGILCTGIAYNYVREAFGGKIPMPWLRIAQYPAPKEKIRQLLAHVDELVIIEEGYPEIEEMVRGVMPLPGKTIRGRLDGFLPRTGELTPAIVARSLGETVEMTFKATLPNVPNRPPALCPGCPHIDSYRYIKDVIDGFDNPVVTSDIGCYTLGFYPPYSAIHSCVDMGASISMASGASHAGMHPVLCTIGDSTFGHSGMTGLLTAAQQNNNMTVLILDNEIVAMTGMQGSLSTGKNLIQIIEGLGVPREHIREIVPLPKNHEENMKILREEIDYRGLSVIISKRACIQIRRK